MIDLAAPILACDGCFVGYPAVISLVILLLTMIGSIYMLLASNLGAKVGYLVTMVSLSAFMIILSLLWLVGGPGTTTATGPRGREPVWVPFDPQSEVAKQDFPTAVESFPNGWDEIGQIYPGKIDSQGEFERLRGTISGALANRALVDETGEPTTTAGWAFRLPGPEVVPSGNPVGRVRYLQDGNTLLFGVTIPATDDHREVTVFAYRDKGLVYLYALYFLMVSVAGFIVHLWLLTRAERKQNEQDAALEGATVTVSA